MEKVYNLIIGFGLLVIAIIGFYFTISNWRKTDNVSLESAKTGLVGLLIILMMLGLYVLI
jgi:glucose uptake protein GlcU